MVSITVTILQYPTENRESVIQALEKIFPVDRDTLTFQDTSETITVFQDDSTEYPVPVTIITLELEGRDALLKIHQLLRQQLIVETARKYFKRSARRGKSMEFLLHKQAAFKNKIHFSEEDESPMGPIRVKIAAEDIHELIDWLAPPTKNGVVLEPNFNDDAGT